MCRAGTVCTITVYQKPKRGLLEKAFGRIAEIDARMGNDRAGSEIDPVNAASIGSGLKYQEFIKPRIPALAEITRRTREVLPLR